MFRPRKAIIFLLVIGTVTAVVSSMSLYKVAVANAFLRLAAPTDEGGAAEAFAAQLVDTPAARARGAHLVGLVGCADCHGADLAGQTLAARQGELTVVAPNLTPAGPTRAYGAARWHAALRWGVDGEWRALWGMPRGALLQLADDDVAALVVYLKTLPPLPRTLPQSQLGWRGYVQVALRRLRVVERRPLPRRAAGAASAHAPAANASNFGPYLAAVGRCGACHGPADGAAVNVVPHLAAPALSPVARDATPATWYARLRQGSCAGAAGHLQGDAALPRGRLPDLSAEEAEALRRTFL